MYRIHRAVHWASLDAYIRSLGPAAWFRMDQGVTVTGAGISQVDDLSGNARHLLDPGTTRPIYLPFTGTRYLYLPGVAGNYASTPDSVANSITGDIDIRVRVALDDWTPATQSQLCSKYETGNWGYAFSVLATGALNFQWSTDGTTQTSIASSVGTGFSDGAIKWVRCTYVTDSGAGSYLIRFLTSDDGVSWVQLGSDKTGAATAATFNGTAAVSVGAFLAGVSGALAGKIYRAIIKSGIDGTTVVDFNPADASDGATSFASSTTGETWTVNSSGALPAQIVGRASALFNGTSHYLKCNAFTLNQPTCVLFVGKQVSWTVSDRWMDGEAANSIGVQQVTVSPQVRLLSGLTPAQTVSPAVGSVVVFAAVFSGAVSLIRVNNESPVATSPGTTNAGGFTLGSRSDGMFSWSNIQVYEVALFPIAPSTAQLDRLIAGLMARHGVA